MEFAAARSYNPHGAVLRPLAPLPEDELSTTISSQARGIYTKWAGEDEPDLLRRPGPVTSAPHSKQTKKWSWHAHRNEAAHDEQIIKFVTGGVMPGTAASSTAGGSESQVADAAPAVEATAAGLSESQVADAGPASSADIGMSGDSQMAPAGDQQDFKFGSVDLPSVGKVAGVTPVSLSDEESDVDGEPLSPESEWTVLDEIRNERMEPGNEEKFRTPFGRMEKRGCHSASE